MKRGKLKNPFATPTTVKLYAKEPDLGDESTLEVTPGLRLDPRHYIDLDTDFQDTDAVLKAGGHLAYLVAFKAVFEGLYFGLSADAVDRKFLAKCMDFLKPKEGDAEGPQAPIVVQVEGMKFEEI